MAWRVESPPGSRWDTPGANAGSRPSRSNGHVDGTVEADLEPVPKILHLDHLDAETRDLLPLMGVGRADADLDEAAGEPLFHDPGERAGVREAIALELVVEVGMRVEVQDRKVRVLSGEGAHDRIRDRVVAAERHGRVPVRQQVSDRRLDAPERVRPGLFAEVAGVVERVAGELPPVLGPGIRGFAEERLADERRRVGGAAQVRGVGIGTESDESQPQGHLRIAPAS